LQGTNLARLRIDVLEKLGLRRCFQGSCAVLSLDFARTEQAPAQWENGQYDNHYAETGEKGHEKYEPALKK